MRIINKIWMLTFLTNWVQNQILNNCGKENLPLPLDTGDSRIQYKPIDRNTVS